MRQLGLATRGCPVAGRLWGQLSAGSLMKNRYVLPASFCFLKQNGHLDIACPSFARLPCEPCVIVDLGKCRIRAILCHCRCTYMTVSSVSSLCFWITESPGMSSVLPSSNLIPSRTPAFWPVGPNLFFASLSPLESQKEAVSTIVGHVYTGQTPSLLAEEVRCYKGQRCRLGRADAYGMVQGRDAAVAVPGNASCSNVEALGDASF